LIVSLLLVAAQAWPDPGKVVSTTDKSANFASIHTYAWVRGHEALDREVHQLIVAAIDAEFTARGLRLAGSQEPADVTVAYHALGSSYVDIDEIERLAKKDPGALAPAKVLGSLAISMRRPGSDKPIWRGHVREVLDPNPAERAATVRRIVGRVFTTYPATRPAA
jgi:hypothetical protein